MDNIVLTQSEFAVIQKLVFKETGISLGDKKINMVQNRLNKRVEHYKLNNYADYLKIVQISKTEKTEFLNCISTNETYFFRETKHFEFLEDIVKRSTSIRVWSAAASMGAEAYSIAMMLDSNLSKNSWEVVGSDINTQVLDIARKGLYQLSWSQKIPKRFKIKYCFKGSGNFENKMLIDRALSKNMNFIENNLMEKNNDIGKFDVIFLRNVLLYFTEETKIKVIKNVISSLNQGGYLILSLTEYFDEKKVGNLKFLKNSIYQKV
ncbi:MAG: protein-glutamate O-methyltransferase CheR [Campylobacterota bacterium]|nr:protein-glutamate O-methyltransferase CheR [Campylobacterota bacterium]